MFGTGQAENALAALDMAVRAVSRYRPAELAGGTDWRAADVTGPQAAADAAKGASAVYQCVNAPYTQWPERFPPLQRGVLTTAERTGLLLAVLENLYDYGPTGGKPMTEDLPLAAATVKGRAGAAMRGELLAAAEARAGPLGDRAGVGLLWPGRRPGVSCLPGRSVRGPRDV